MALMCNTEVMTILVSTICNAASFLYTSGGGVQRHGNSMDNGPEIYGARLTRVNRRLVHWESPFWSLRQTNKQKRMLSCRQKGIPKMPWLSLSLSLFGLFPREMCWLRQLPLSESIHQSIHTIRPHTHHDSFRGPRLCFARFFTNLSLSVCRAILTARTALAASFGAVFRSEFIRTTVRPLADRRAACKIQSQGPGGPDLWEVAAYNPSYN
jgi:hypothetical protein